MTQLIVTSYPAYGMKWPTWLRFTVRSVQKVQSVQGTKWQRYDIRSRSRCTPLTRSNLEKIFSLYLHCVLALGIQGILEFRCSRVVVLLYNKSGRVPPYWHHKVRNQRTKLFAWPMLLLSAVQYSTTTMAVASWCICLNWGLQWIRVEL